MKKYKPTVIKNPKNGKIIGVIPRTREQFLEEFWGRVNVRGQGDCWEWMGAKKSKAGRNQYGIVWWGNKRYNCHVLSFELKNGPIKDGLLVCHKCDNPKCVNPAHLFAGTPTDNMRDCAKKGRLNSERGEERYNAKLTNEDVLNIRRDHVPGKYGSLKRLAEKYGVRNTMIFSIVNRQRWKHI